MSVSVTMPALGESVVEGTVTRWLKQVGDTVAMDEPLLEVSTDKVDTEIPSPVAGVLLEISAEEDDIVEVGGQLAVIGERASQPATPTAAPSAAPAAPSAAPAVSQESAVAGQAVTPPAQPTRDHPESTVASPNRIHAPAPSHTTTPGHPEAPSGFPAPPTGSPLNTLPPPTSSTPAASMPPPSMLASPQRASLGNPTPVRSDPQPAVVAPPVADVSAPLSTPATTPSTPSLATTPAAPESATQVATEVKLPALGESVVEGTVTRWLKEVGDTVAVDEPLLEVSTDKVDTEIPSPVAGVLTQILVAEDETADVGAVLALVGGAGVTPSQALPAPTPVTEITEADSTTTSDDSTPTTTPAPPAAAVPTPPVAPSAAAVPTPPVAPSAAAAAPGGGAYVTPLVRRMAKDSGVDLSAVVGTGVGGRVRKEDVQAVIAAQQSPGQPVAIPKTPAPEPTPAPDPSPLRGTTEKISRLRRVIADRMIESLQVSAQLTTVIEVDVTRISHLRDTYKADFLARHGVKLSYLPFFCLAAVEALRQFPQVNASVDMAAGTVSYHGAEHLGIAVDSERGLLVPVIQNAGDLDLGGLAKAIGDLAERTRSNKLSPDDLSGGTFTLTNTGSRGALFDTPIINQPQVAILGTGMVVKRPVVTTDDLGDDTIAIRSMVYLALTYDHRLVDGADAARFLSAMKTRLEAGSFEGSL